MPYPLLRPLLFALEAETAHHLTLESLKMLQRFGLAGTMAARPVAGCDCKVMGIEFPNPVGLAAGLDKNGDYIDALAALGFGFIEIGTVTPRPQPGNPRPRLFRVRQAAAVINRMGFNNSGVDQLISNVRRASYRGVLGINIGKNFDTPIDRAADDYLHCLRKVYALASYVTVNISSPNTKDLRLLQESAALESMLGVLKAEQRRLADQHGKYVPLTLKIAPDLEQAQVGEIAGLLLKHEIDGVIAGNTTVTRGGVDGMENAAQSGGLSGAPLTRRSTSIVRQLAQALAGSVPVIGVGGIMNGDDAVQKFAAGANLVQLYTGLVFSGPALISECLSALCKKP
jgi:dihydroorotate dehydrogenase